MRRATTTLCAALAFAAVAATTARAQSACVGDCNHSGTVLVNELIIGVNIDLGITPVTQCPSFDRNNDGTVTVADLVAGVNNALTSCPMSPTPTATPVGTERVFTIEPGIGFAPPEASRSGLFTDVLGANGANMMAPGPLTLVLGTPDPVSGIASLRLKEDVTLAITTADFNCLCMKLTAQGSDGSIDCDGGSVYDTKAERANNASGFAWTVTTGLGQPSGPGNGNLLISALFEPVVGTCAHSDCPNFQYHNPPNIFAFTTTNATGIQDTSTQPRIYTVPGEPFDCATFSTPGKGMLAAPAPTTIAPVGDVANVFRFGEALPQ